MNISFWKKNKNSIHIYMQGEGVGDGDPGEMPIKLR